MLALEQTASPAKSSAPPFDVRPLSIPEVLCITPRCFQDERGFFSETYKASAFQAFGIRENFVQDNHSRSTKDVLRGLHFQYAPKAQAKLVRCIVGQILDVVVDIRPSSPTFKQWTTLVLSAENRHMLYVPAGFAHGFLTQSDMAEIVYKTSNEYSPELDAGILWNDPELSIDWQLENNPILSAKDTQMPTLASLVKEGRLS
jgi:dTDP-4-dehydrorhamnose 3,5-epimerase